MKTLKDCEHLIAKKYGRKTLFDKNEGLLAIMTREVAELYASSKQEKLEKAFEELEMMSNNYRVINGNYVISKYDLDELIERTKAELKP